MTTIAAVLGVVLGVLICADGARAWPRVALGGTVVVASLLLAGTQSYPPDLSALDRVAALPAGCGAPCAFSFVPAAVRPSLSERCIRGERSVMPDQRRLEPVVPAGMADPLVPGRPAWWVGPPTHR